MVTEFAGSVAPSADMNYQFTPPLCQVVQQTAQTGWTTATPTAVTFGASSTVIDTDGAHSESSNTSRIVIGKRLGWWEVDGYYAAPNNSAITTIRAILYRNSTAILGSSGQAGAPGSGVFSGVPTKPSFLVQATAASDYVELFGYQTAASGTIGTAIVSPYIASCLTARWIRDS